MSVPAASVAGTFFFSRKAAKPRSFWEPRINTESHGFFYGKVFFCVFAFLRENFKLWVASHFASLTKRLPAKSLCVKGFFSREAAKPRSFWEPRINTESHGSFYGKVFFLRLRVFAREALLCPRKKILLCTGTLCYENFFPFTQTSR